MNNLMSILPAFDMFSDEALLISKMLAGYGEIEYELSRCIDSTQLESNMGLRILFRMRSEQMRIDVADAILRDYYTKFELEEKYLLAKATIIYCRKLRNQYAHCHWLGIEGNGLFFTNLEEPASKSTDPMLTLHHVSVDLLEKQLLHFVIARSCLLYLREGSLVQLGTLLSNVFVFPSIPMTPPLYSPAGTYTPLDL